MFRLCDSFITGRNLCAFSVNSVIESVSIYRPGGYPNLQTTWVRQQQRIIQAVNKSIECLWVSRFSGCQQRIDRGKPSVPVFVHPGFGEVELGFFVLLIAGEFLADAVAEVVGQICAAIGAVDSDLFAEGFEVSSRDDGAECVGDDTRAAELIRGRVAGCRSWRRLSSRVFGYQLAVRINEDSLLGRVYRVALVKDLLFYPLSLAVEEILRDLVAVVRDLGLFVVGVECETSTLGVVDQISVVIVGVALTIIKSILVCVYSLSVEFVYASCVVPLKFEWLARLPYRAYP